MNSDERSISKILDDGGPFQRENWGEMIPARAVPVKNIKNAVLTNNFLLIRLR
jgi:hypothetical protein